MRRHVSALWLHRLLHPGVLPLIVKTAPLQCATPPLMLKCVTALVLPEPTCLGSCGSGSAYRLNEGT